MLPYYNRLFLFSDSLEKTEEIYLYFTGNLAGNNNPYGFAVRVGGLLASHGALVCVLP
jgi:hypothetical protein